MDHPERLGKYRITGVLGEGAMGVVYRGFDPDIRRLVALKTIRRQPGDAGGSAFDLNGGANNFPSGSGFDHLTANGARLAKGHRCKGKKEDSQYIFHKR